MNYWKDINSIFDNQQFKEFVKLLNAKLKILKVTENDLKSAFILPISQGGTGQTSQPLKFSGLEIGNIDGGNYLEIESDGTPHLIGDATVYEDIRFSISVAKIPPANAPTWTTFTANTSLYTFALNDYCWLTTEEPMHSRKSESNIETHLHIYTNGVDVNDRTLKFELYYVWTEENGVASESLISNEWTIPANTPDKTLLKFSFGTLNGTGKTLNTQIIPTLKRVASSGTEPTSDPFVSMVGGHAQIDTPGGSRTATTK